MAKMYPEHPTYCRFESDAERTLYHELKHQLPDSVVVMHSVPLLLRPDERKELNCEIDFVVIDPDRGVLVLEVKGGGVSRDSRTGQWHSIDADGNKHEINDPFQQAKRNRYALVEKLQEAPRTRAFKYHIRHAVAFPDRAVGNQYLGPDSDPDIVIDGPALQNLPRAIERALGTPAKHSRIGPLALDALVQALSPSIDVRRPSLGFALRQTESFIVQLTESQYRILRLLGRQRRAKIAGCAGSGKTMLAIEKARRLAEQGLTVLLTCFNASLASWMQYSFLPREIYGWPSDPTDYRLVVLHYHELARRLCMRANIPFPEPFGVEAQEETARFYREEAPDLMLQALDRVPDRFDAVIVDEAQDFYDEWWVTLIELLADPDQSILYAFYDDNQLIYQQDVRIPIEGEPYVLNENIRNTRQIFQVFSKYYQGSEPPVCLGPDGPEVEHVPLNDTDLPTALRQTFEYLFEEEQIPLTDVVVLTPVRKDSRLNSLGRVGKWRLSWDRSGSQPDRVQVSTIHAFKGLEKPVVILTELDRAYPGNAEQLLYVGLSRARSHLIVLGDLPVLWRVISQSRLRLSGLIAREDEAIERR